MKKSLFQTVKPHLIALAVFIVICCAYFLPQIQGETIMSNDLVSYKYMSNEAREFNNKTGETTHWTNSMFGGMPTYQITSPVKSNLLSYVENASNLFFGRPIGYFLAMMTGMYILLLTLGANPWLAIIGAIALGFTSNNFILFEAGHTSKMRAIAFLAPMAAGMLMTYRGKYLWGGVLFAVAAGVELLTNHPQMTYYFALAAIIFVILQFVEDARKGNLLHFAKASGILVLGTALAIGASYSKINSTLEYSKDTMRGKPILESKGQAASSSQTDGLEWNYSMQWSNGGTDLWATLIPGFAGGGSQEKVSSKSEFSKMTRQKIAPLYWGALPFTSGPAYFGAGMMFLFVLGLLLVKDKIKWWLASAVVFTFLLSMGKNLEGFNRIFFDYFPLFNSFRAPSSILSVTAVFIPILGVLGLSNILNGKTSRDAAAKAVMIAGGIVGGICLFFGFAGGSFFDFAANSDAQYLNNPQIPGQKLVDALVADRASFMQADALRSFGIIAVCAALIYLFIKNKISQTVMLVGLGLVTVFDLWTVGKRYLDDDSFQKKSKIERNFVETEADKQILKDPDLSYRVFDLRAGGNVFQNARASYFHKSLGGYHAAKLQRIQDMIDYHLSRNNQKVVNMFNTKYIITQEGTAQRNGGALGNGWFVQNIKTVNTPNEEIEALNDIEPATTAVVLNEFSDYVAGLNPNGAGSIKLIDYKPNKLTYSAKTDSENLAVFSEVWYGPNKGWQAYIDGQPVDHIRTNYILRALKVPAGNHEIVFEFDPQSFKTGEIISYISSAIILLGFLYLLFISLRDWYAGLPETLPVSSPKKAVKKTTSKRKK